MRSTLVCTFLASLALALGSTSAQADPVRRRAPIDVHDEALGSLIFGQLVIPEDVLGEEEGYLKDKQVKVYNEELRRLGYDVPADASSVFKSDELPDTDFLLAGTMTEFECSRENDGTCGLTIEWELLHRDSHHVVYKMVSNHEETKFGRKGTDTAAKNILLGGLRSLLSRPKFVDALRDVEGPESAVVYQPVTLARCVRKPLALPKQAKDAIKATALVKSGDSVGSAVFISPDGYLLTAAHVATRDDLKVQLSDGKELDAEVVRLSERHDVALVRVNTSRRSRCLVVDENFPDVGQDVFAIGSPVGEELSFSISRGIVSGKRGLEGADYLQTDASINPGNSGGPMLGDKGEVYAIASWKLGGDALEGLGFGVPSSVALEALGIRFGEQSSVVAPQVERVDISAVAVVDEADPPWHYVGEDAPGKTPKWVHRMRRWGKGGLYTGVAFLALGGVAAAAQGGYDAASPLNLAGWGLALGGAGMVVGAHFLKPPGPSEQRVAKRRAQVTARVGLTHISVEGTF